MSSSLSSSRATPLSWVAGLAVVFLGLVAAEPATAWGQTGHRIVGAIAEARIADETRRQIAVLVGPESLVDVAVWADDVKSDPAWEHADDWHYVSVPDGVDPTDAPRLAEGDVLRRLGELIEVLRDPARPRAEREIALRFLVHFVGDIHQPLHVGRKADRGGNEIEVEWFGRPTNLHWVWDTGIQAARYLSYTEHAERILRIRGPGLPRTAGRPADWARESMSVRPLVYDLPADRDLGFDYVYVALPVVEERLGQAGARLAALLDEALARPAPPARPVPVAIALVAAGLLVVIGGRRR